MQYRFMAPADIQQAIRDAVPVVLAIGNLEYHSGHLPVGTDALVTEGCLNLLEKRHPEMVVLPPFYYGVSSYAVAGPEEGRGTVSVDSRNVSAFAEDLFTNLLEVGFRNIHGFLYHQTENFLQGMPMDLAFRFAGRRAIFAYMERTRGRGWWGNPDMRGYYDDPANNIFNWIQIHPVVSEQLERQYGSDHAGKVETSAMLELYPETVHMERLIAADWFAEASVEASREFGRQYVTAAVDELEQLLFK